MIAKNHAFPKYSASVHSVAIRQMILSRTQALSVIRDGAECLPGQHSSLN